MSYIGRSSKLFQRAYTKVSFLATAGQTSKTGLSYTPTFVEVYVNGVLLTDTTDFTATNGNSVTFTVALLLNDEVTVVSLKTFTVADHYNKTEADTLLAAKLPLAGGTVTGDITVSGGVYLGGTGSANKLDDYEQGNFTPNVQGATTAGTGTYSTLTGRYVKVGNIVSFSVYIAWTAHTGSGYLQFGNLPFTSASTTNLFTAVTTYASNISLNANNVITNTLIHPATTYGSPRQCPTGGGSADIVAMDTSGTLLIAGTYLAN